MVRVQLHGGFAVVVDGRSITADLPGRRGRMLVAYLAAHPRGADRSRLIDLLWHPAEPGPSAPAGFAALLSKARAALAPIEIRGRQNLQLVLAPDAVVDTAVAAAALHEADAAAARRDWRRAWTQALSTLFVLQREFLADLDHPWIDERRRELAHDHDRALACYAEACLHLGPTELASAERSARRLIASQPLAETGYCLLMRALAARGDRAAALGVYAELQAVLRAELGTAPGPVAAAVHADLL
ncbi:DNA-binding transcriptional activator of the SARP family [Pseudonocardia thermophila]|uniref:DNA-binding transcriptional activator of the SARP family n=1 Tax=Pseudonocardia thermophila TaxID=1848 RepID=A0A1M6U1H4_PSETH|nr:BTAD domain-containing putative transcriptional regulator [Pseudonocardia thermophila]SHK63046.1 DNA-binding transcriptional activator of the SARP family [Pseudonocardia thermophila]